MELQSGAGLPSFPGDFDAFLKEMGVGYMARSLAKSRGYGVKSVHQAVEHSLDKIKVVQTTPKGTTVSEIRLDGTEQDSQSAYAHYQVTPTCWFGFMV